VGRLRSIASLTINGWRKGASGVQENWRTVGDRWRRI
jgi:hypothetical protein